MSVGLSLWLAPGLEGLLGAALGLTIVAIAVVDAQHFVIPDELNLALALLGLMRAALIGFDAGAAAICLVLLRGAAAALPLLILMVLYRHLRGRDGLGLGDVKLAAVAGIWLDWMTIVYVIQLAALSGLGAYLIASRLRKRPLKAQALLPFGLFFAPAIWLGWIAETMWF